MKIGVVTNAYHPDVGGVETHVRRLCAALAAEGDDIEVMTQASRTVVERIDGVLVRRFPLTVSAANYRFSLDLWRWLSRHAGRYALLHAHSYHALAALPAALTNHTPLVFTPHYHGTGHSLLRAALHPVYRPLGRRIVARSSRIICVTRAERDLLTRHFPEAEGRMVVIPNGTDPARDLVVPPEPGRSILCVGRLERYKRVDRVIRAMLHLDDEYRLDVVGSGPARVELQQLAFRLGLDGDRVVFHGRLGDDDFAARMAVATAVVSASAHEAFGMAVADALTAGIPTVASFIPAHRELAVLAGCGVPLWLVNPDDEVALADALRTAAGTARAATGRHALPTWSDVVLATREVYAAVLPRVPA
ncbi:glycosyltransferase family 4 protein [Actinoplanes sp. TBRC 11911]|uniref:glycosyltransferase family 4 protein n=1 Tax=Actinoplanes sp. TBRC 11911 TaxID=2729386 RepID=UPI00145C906C|nr:glycosyltransferase family 4 protein [Actinoplanes sp. TBRC 11911]NMO53249.1 glycosyltransferase family 4 protein [Actinoplanes sp. TBRC 11911]